MPAGLAAALDDLGAVLVGGWQEGSRVYLRARSGEEPLFARHSRAASDDAVLRHEVEVRTRIARDTVLRSPPILALGPGWHVEREIAAEPLEGPEAVDLAVEAAERIARLRLPVSDAPRATGGSLLGRIAAVHRSPLPLTDVVRARIALASPGLPLGGSHGDFHADNILLAEGAVWIVDWERSGRRPWGYDLMRLHATLRHDDDRERLLECALDLAGPRRRQLLRLAHALLVRTIADRLLGANSFDRDPYEARRLLDLLPRFRGAA